MIRKLSSVYVLAYSGFAIRCCPITDSQLILELLVLFIRGGYSLTVLLFFLMFVETVSFILSASVRVVHLTAQKVINCTTFLSGRNTIYLNGRNAIFLSGRNAICCESRFINLTFVK